jgi:hypothetical protein
MWVMSCVCSQKVALRTRPLVANRQSAANSSLRPRMAGGVSRGARSGEEGQARQGKQPSVWMVTSLLERLPAPIMIIDQRTQRDLPQQLAL